MKTIWLSRDFSGQFKNRIYVWTKKPIWNKHDQVYNCCDENCPNCTSDEDAPSYDCTTSVTNLPLCEDFTSILMSLGCGLDGCGITKGEIIELAVTATVTKSKTFASQAQDLVTRLRSRKKPTQRELITFLDCIEDVAGRRGG